MALSEAKKQQQRDARALLEGFWPEAFNFSQPRPLKLGVFEELVADAKLRGLPFDAAILKAAMKSYTSRYVYQQAVSKIAERTGLDGSPWGEVSAEQKAYAKVQLQRIDAKAKARKKALEADAAAKPVPNEPDA